MEYFSPRKSRKKIAVSQISNAPPPGTKAAIPPELNGLSVPNFEQARGKHR